MFVNTTESINLVFRAEVTLILPRSVVKRYGYINLKVLPISRMRTFIRNTDFGVFRLSRHFTTAGVIDGDHCRREARQ